MMKKTTAITIGVAVAATLVLALFAGPALGATYNLRAAPTTKIMPDSTEVPMWGYALVSYDLGEGVVSMNGPVTIPGPQLTVPPGQGLTVNLTNEIPAPVSIIILGQIGASPQVTRNADGRVTSFTQDTPPNATLSYTWPDLEPGTYLYHSGTHPQVQVQMGLYGAVTKDAAGGQAYLGQAYAYDAEAVILYSAIDPVVHAAADADPAGYSATVDYQPKYFLVNGEAGDPVAPVVTAGTGQTVLLRLLNAGLKSHAPEILGAHLKVIAEDGNLYPFARKHYALLLAAGKTLDALLVPPSAGNYSIFDRRLYRSDPSVEGTMHTYVSVTP
jgi:FtsP/CotA-like multicopper oxidase with cupredoxin domain